MGEAEHEKQPVHVNVLFEPQWRQNMTNKCSFLLPLCESSPGVLRLVVFFFLLANFSSFPIACFSLFIIMSVVFFVLVNFPFRSFSCECRRFSSSPFAHRRIVFLRL